MTEINFEKPVDQKYPYLMVDSTQDQARAESFKLQFRARKGRFTQPGILHFKVRTMDFREDLSRDRQFYTLITEFRNHSKHLLLKDYANIAAIKKKFEEPIQYKFTPAKDLLINFVSMSFKRQIFSDYRKMDSIKVIYDVYVVDGGEQTRQKFSKYGRTMMQTTPHLRNQVENDLVFKSKKKIVKNKLLDTTFKEKQLELLRDSQQLLVIVFASFYVFENENDRMHFNFDEKQATLPYLVIKINNERVFYFGIWHYFWLSFALMVLLVGYLTWYLHRNSKQRGDRGSH